MPSNPKLYVSNKVSFVTSRIEEGLPLVASEHVKLILEGILARATERYDITLCHHVWMGNHFHMVVVVRDPEAVSRFLCFLKTESSHAVNHLLGRTRRTVWSGGSDSPILLTAEDVIEKIAYLYANPAEAHLVDTIDEYPMLSSWEMYRKRQCNKQCPIICRDKIPSIGPKHLSLRHQRAFATALSEGSKSKATLTIDPYAWVKCFPELKGLTKAQIDELVISRVREKEDIARKNHNGNVLGALALRTQDMDIHHQPKKFARKMICICRDISLRLEFIRWAKDLFSQAKNVYSEWKKGNPFHLFPPGLFPPRPPRSANILAPV